MTMRLLNIVVIAALVVAASYVYKIKFDSTLQAERVAKVRSQLRHEREAIAILRAEWAKLETPARVKELADRHLHLRPIKPHQIADFEKLPPRPLPPAPGEDPIAAMLAPKEPAATGSIAARR
jgi:cell division protein FtsL